MIGICCSDSKLNALLPQLVQNDRQIGSALYIVIAREALFLEIPNKLIRQVFCIDVQSRFHGFQCRFQIICNIPVWLPCKRTIRKHFILYNPNRMQCFLRVDACI